MAPLMDAMTSAWGATVEDPYKEGGDGDEECVATDVEHQEVVATSVEKGAAKDGAEAPEGTKKNMDDVSEPSKRGTAENPPEIPDPDPAQLHAMLRRLGHIQLLALCFSQSFF